ncbi:MAG: hypothetical protein ABEH56_07780 [Salinirussus sp.]
MSTDPETEETATDRVPLTEQLPPETVDTVLIYGPAMSGKRSLGLDLLAAGVAETAGRPLYVSTTDPASTARAAVDARVSDAGHLPTPAVVDATAQSVSAPDQLTRTVSSPAELTGIAVAVSEILSEAPRSTRLGSRVLVDNVSALLLYTDVEPVCRFLHALGRRVADAGGGTIATLDTDGLDPAELTTLRPLFATAVEVREGAGGFEYRVDEGNWHGYDPNLDSEHDADLEVN